MTDEVKEKNVVVERLERLVEKVKMSIPTERVLVEHRLLFGRFKVMTTITYLDLKENWTDIR